MYCVTTCIMSPTFTCDCTCVARLYATNCSDTWSGRPYMIAYHRATCKKSTLLLSIPSFRTRSGDCTLPFLPPAYSNSFAVAAQQDLGCIHFHKTTLAISKRPAGCVPVSSSRSNIMFASPQRWHLGELGYCYNYWFSRRRKAKTLRKRQFKRGTSHCPCSFAPKESALPSLRSKTV